MRLFGISRQGASAGEAQRCRFFSEKGQEHKILLEVGLAIWMVLQAVNLDSSLTYLQFKRIKPLRSRFFLRHQFIGFSPYIFVAPSCKGAHFTPIQFLKTSQKSIAEMFFLYKTEVCAHIHGSWPFFYVRTSTSITFP